MNADREAWMKLNGSVPMDACSCVGRQNGQPKCPCSMRGVIVRDGRYIQPEVDLGPVAAGEVTPWPTK